MSYESNTYIYQLILMITNGINVIFYKLVAD